VSANGATPEIVPSESSAADRAAMKIIVIRKARATAESITTDEAPRAAPVPGDEASAIIARGDPVGATIGRHRAVSVDAVISVDPYVAGRAQRRRRVRSNGSGSIVTRPTLKRLSTVKVRNAVIVRIVITRAALRARVTGSPPVDISPELALRKNRTAS